jgi:hypothetical protein
MYIPKFDGTYIPTSPVQSLFRSSKIFLRDTKFCERDIVVT